ncbi:MAG TPA: Asp-tRNA(Asn)/Glu-tRNA(Gln) amidotransferase subunit GatB [Candidatus Paceibacterota bacterium]
MKGTYIATIGLEIHAELKTQSKMFCSCKNDRDEEKPNVNICPVCLAHPGTLPVLNKEAIKHVLKIGYAVNGDIADFTEWDRKNYFYPDIPKGYQISQYKYPLVSGGVMGDVAITRIHLEEDTAQSTHDTHAKSLINFNRAGVPLMELVTEPVIHSGEVAVNFAKNLQLLLRYLGVGEANMEKGEMRVEANISIATEEDTKNKKFGVKTEVKNLNSFKVVEKAIAYEIKRQTKLLENGDRVIQETRGWDDVKGETYSQRAKESSHDYRYFPDPDIPKLKISEIEEFSKKNITKELIELPWEKRLRYKNDYKMTDKEAEVFVEAPQISEYFERVVANKKDIVRLATNYILTDYVGLLKKENKDVEKKIKNISPDNFSKLMDMINGGKISSRGAKDILVYLMNEDTDPMILGERHGLMQKSDEGEIKRIAEEIIKNNPTVVDDYKKGKIAALQFLLGQGMKVTKGSVNPEVFKKIILEML